MKLKLKEEPREWRHFVLVWCAVGLVVTVLLYRKGIAGKVAVQGVVGGLIAVAITACVLPRLFRGCYRVGMTASFHVGQVMGKVILTLVFFLAVVPMSLLLRLLGKDLLELKKRPNAGSYWKEARRGGTFEQQF